MAYKINKQLGEKIQRVRKSKNISQMKLAEMIGVQTTTIGNIERGETDTSVQFIRSPKLYGPTSVNCLPLDKFPKNFCRIKKRSSQDSSI